MGSETSKVKMILDAVSSFHQVTRNALPMHIAATEADLPQAVRDKHQGQGPIKGVTTGNAVFLVAGNIKDAEEARMTTPEAASALRDQVVGLGYAPEQARLKVALLEARANVWARRTGGSAADWFAQWGIRFERGADGMGEGDFAQAAMYRTTLSLDDFLEAAAASGGEKESFITLGQTKDGEDVNLRASEVRHIQKGHPGFRGWSDIIGVIAEHDHMHSSTRKGKAYVSYARYSGGQGIGVVLERSGARWLVKTAFEDSEKGVRAWMKKEEDASGAQAGNPEKPQVSDKSENVIRITSSSYETVGRVGEHVKALAAGLRVLQGGAANALPMHIAATEADLPQAVRDKHQGQGPIKGVATCNAVFLVAGNSKDAERLCVCGDTSRGSTGGCLSRMAASWPGPESRPRPVTLS